MFYVEMYFRVRRACLVEGMSVREASRVFDLHRDTVRKMLDNATPQGYTRQSPPRKPKLEPYTGVIDAILAADGRVPRKQRHTAKRIFERLRDEYGFDGQHTIVKDYVREHRRRVREMFVPLSHAPGHAQCDFGGCPASTIFAGWRQSVLPVHLLGLAPLLGSVGPVAGDVQLQDDGVVHDPVNRRGGGHGVGKDALPLREDQV